MGTFAETAIVDYRLSFVYQGKQMSVFPFSFASDKRKFAVSVFRLQKTNEVAIFFQFRFLFVEFRKCEDVDMEGDMKTLRHGDMESWRQEDKKTWSHEDMETRRQGDMETWRHGDMETWRQGDKETWRYGDMETGSWRHQTELFAEF
jgi:hypothetical protein